MSAAVRLGPPSNGDGDRLLRTTCDRVVAEDVPAALALAARLTDEAPAPGSGATQLRWELLASLAAVDLTTARVVEAHLDAVAILREAVAQVPLTGTTWGVFAAEGGGVRLEAVEPAATRLATRDDPATWQLDGTKPWCSLAGSLSHALVTAHTPAGRRLFAVDLTDPGVRPYADAWHARGLVHVPSGPVTFSAVPGQPVGAAGWYLDRPGFAYGGLGVAACWYGGAVGVARALWRSLGLRAADEIALWHLGSVDVALHRSRSVLAEAAEAVDSGRATGPSGARLALRVRTVVAQAAEQVLSSVGHALGPAPLARDAAHAGRVADLTLYLRQHHGERDEVELGRQLAEGGAPW